MSDTHYADIKLMVLLKHGIVKQSRWGNTFKFVKMPPQELDRLSALAAKEIATLMSAQGKPVLH
jgi:hypothetical protein